ncbi:MAG: acyl-CoA thioesterase [Hyphococcus sp.]
MTTSFSTLMASARIRNGALGVEITDDWMQGRTTYGGLSAALCLETALRAFPDLPPLRSAMISFIGPAGGAVEGEARILRQGKSVTFVEADIAGERGLATRCVFAFGAARPSIFERTWTPAPAMPGPEACEPFIPPGFGPNFATHFDTGLAQGARPGMGSSEHDHFIWVRHRDENATGMAALLAVADMPPPAVMPMFPEFKPVSSMTWQMNVLADAPATRDGWWLLESRAENAARGYSSQDMLVWNRDGDLVIAGRQSVAIFL